MRVLSMAGGPSVALVQRGATVALLLRADLVSPDIVDKLDRLLDAVEPADLRDLDLPGGFELLDSEGFAAVL